MRYLNLAWFDTIGKATILFGFFLIVFVILLILLYVFGSLGLMELAKKNKIENAWLAFIPLGSTYLLGKLGFEVYPEEVDKKPALVWVFFGLSAAVFIGIDIGSYVSLAVLVFSIFAYRNIYKYMFPNQVTKYTILSFFFGALPLYFSREKIVSKEEKVVNFEAHSNNMQTSTQEGNMKVKFCSSCGKQLNENDKFCTNCGNKIM